jgi:tetratricopeptide (TPR) repeat protein
MPNETENLLLQANEALEAKQYAKAEALQAQACKLMRGERADEYRLAIEIEKLADIHCVQKKFDQCANEYSEVVQMREKFMPANDFNILRPLYRLAKSHFEGQEYELAEVEMRKALALTETRNDSPESLAFCLYELGWLLYFVGKYQEAEPYLLKALPICETVHGPSHPQTVQVSGGIALLYKNCADLGEDPEPYFRRAIEASKSNANLRESYLLNLGRLASFLNESERFDDADGLYLELLSVIRGTPDQDDSDKRWIIRDCVEYFTKRGREELVADLAASAANHNVYMDMVKERLNHAERTLSEDDPEFAEALFTAGNNATFEGNYQEAEQLLERALAAAERIHGEKSSQVLFALNRVCIVKRLLGKFADAESAIQKAVSRTRECFSDQGLYPWTLENLALLREAEGKADDAELSYAEAVAEYEKICGFPTYETAEALYHQSGCLLRMGKTVPAEAAIRRAISVMDTVEQLSGYEKSDYLGTLASILEATGRHDEAVEMQSRADGLFEQAKKQNENQE